MRLENFGFSFRPAKQVSIASKPSSISYVPFLCNSSNFAIKHVKPKAAFHCVLVKSSASRKIAFAAAFVFLVFSLYFTPSKHEFIVLSSLIESLCSHIHSKA